MSSQEHQKHGRARLQNRSKPASSGEQRGPQDSPYWRAQESPGDHRTSQESPDREHIMRTQKSTGRHRRAQRNPRGAKRTQKSTGEPRRAQENPGEPKGSQESSGEPRRAEERAEKGQESPGKLHRSTGPQESAQEHTILQESALDRRRAHRSPQERRTAGEHAFSAIRLSLSDSSLRQLQGLQHGCANCLKHSCNGNPWTLKFNDLTRLYRLGSTNCQEAPSENQILKLRRFWRFRTKLLKKTPKIFTRVVPQHDSETRLRKAALGENAKHSSKSASLVDSYRFENVPFRKLHVLN